MQNLIFVGLGGFIGSVLRYLVSGWLQRLSDAALFPYGTLGVNVLGCLLIGLLGGWADNTELFSPAVRLFLLLGVLGGFTTYSTFGYETVALLRDRQMLAATAYVGLHLLLGFGAVTLGYGLSNLKG
ncbi:MAG TPA: fluoride efflux transporter CrcB [Sedimentisphaerales bacterium]|nr:fluoride efflux transporter CrcB [Sedimentisphaerales bacterium]HRS12282.1 fluoride efflux transporter CrcB [Sedimentisphaerales bacterium]HRV48871.1 fluoride efflux transporter CrcB [Sedimentisphaerales bacterium]